MGKNKIIKLDVIKNHFVKLYNSERPAVFFNNCSISHKNLIAQSLSLAKGLEKKGLNKSDKIVIQLENSVEFIYCYLATLFGGYTIIPLDTSLGKSFYDYIIQITQPKLIINDVNQLCFEKNHDFFFRTNIDSTYAIFFTSGTTGKPKGVCHSIGTLFNNASSFNKFVGFDNNLVMMHVMPMGYMAGFLNTMLCPIASGGSIIIAPKFSFKNVFEFWSPAINNNANSVWLSPTMLSLISKLTRNTEHISWVQQNIKNVFVGTAPLPETIKKQFRDKFSLNCFESYGLTETLIVATNKNSDENKPNSVGEIIPGAEIKLLKIEDYETNNYRIFVKSSYLFQKYFLEKDNNFIENEWFLTGDLGFIDDDKYLYITGREKDLIIHGGMNVSPIIVENVILELPGIDDVIVVGKPHEFWGEEVVAFIKVGNQKNMDKSKLIEHCKSVLSPDAVPSMFIEIDQIPRTSTGKPKKFELLSTL